MNRMIRALLPILVLALADASNAGAQYPNVDRPVIIEGGDTVHLLIRYMNDGGPTTRGMGKRLDFVYSTRIPASDPLARRAQADRAAQTLGAQAIALGVRRMSIGICDTRPCAERKHPPAGWYLYERTNSGWKRAP